LKADADSLGVVFEHLLSNGNDLRPMADFSRELDQFFTDTLQREIKFGADSRWQSIYTVFAGGDDLLLVGPWDVMFEFAGRMRELFKQQFGGCGLTLSAGIALTKPKRPIKAVVAEAERLLERAKVGTKDQVAAFGQCWKWHHHSKITANARQLVQWVEAGKARRGWLHTLLELAQSRQGEKDREVPAEPLATPRLAWHVDRNYRDSAVRRWGEQLVERFDRLEDPEINFLPATLRYALTATRSPGEED
jgi:CRISPR-associated protein Csm1